MAFKIRGMTLCEMCPNTEFFFGPYFPAFGLNTNQEKLRIWAHFTQCEIPPFFTIYPAYYKLLSYKEMLLRRSASIILGIAALIATYNRKYFK